MATYSTIPALFKAIGNAIRTKDSTSVPISHQDMPARIKILNSGSGANVSVDDGHIGINLIEQPDLFVDMAGYPVTFPVANNYLGALVMHDGWLHMIDGNNTVNCWYVYLGNTDRGVASTDYVAVARDDGLTDYWLMMHKACPLPYVCGGCAAISRSDGIHIFGGNTHANKYASNRHSIFVPVITTDLSGNITSYSATTSTLTTTMPVSSIWIEYWCKHPFDADKVFFKGDKIGGFVYEYDFNTDTYVSLPGLNTVYTPGQRSYSIMSSYDRAIYIIGGYNKNYGSTTSATVAYNCAFKFNLDTWTYIQLPDFPVKAINVDMYGIIDGLPTFVATATYNKLVEAINLGYVYSLDIDKGIWIYRGMINKHQCYYLPDMNTDSGHLEYNGHPLVLNQVYASSVYRAFKNISYDFGEFQFYDASNMYRTNHTFADLKYYSKTDCIHYMGEQFEDNWPGTAENIGYDFVNKRIQRFRNAPYQLSKRCCICEYKGELHVFSGNGDQDGHCSYNAMTDEWRQYANCPYTDARYSMCVVYKDKIHLIGGNATAQAKKHYVYDYATDTWSVLNNTPVNFYHGELIATDDTMYYILPAGDTDGIYKYKDTTDEWELIYTGITAGSGRCGAIWLDGYLFVLRAGYLWELSKETLAGNGICAKHKLNLTAAQCNEVQFAMMGSDNGHAHFNENGDCEIYFMSPNTLFFKKIVIHRTITVEGTKEIAVKLLGNASEYMNVGSKTFG